MKLEITMTKLFYYLTIILASFCCLAMSSTNTVTENTEGNYYLYVHVSYPDGGDYSGVKVQGEVCGALGGMTSSTRTDSKGYAKLTYSSHEDLCKIFVNGKTNKGRWSEGGTAYFTSN